MIEQKTKIIGNFLCTQMVDILQCQSHIDSNNYQIVWRVSSSIPSQDQDAIILQFSNFVVTLSTCDYSYS